MSRKYNPAIQQAHHENRKSALALLDRAQIGFSVSNRGAHLIVQSRLGLIDFWPGTGRWIPRCDPSFKRHGISELISWIKAAA